jgi:hypothetical protein
MEYTPAEIKNARLNTQTAKAIAHKVMEHTVAFLDLKSAELKLSSSVLIKIGDYVFIAGAAHSFVHPNDLCPITDVSTPIGERLLQKVRYRVNDHYDIAYLEVASADLDGKKPISLNEISTELDRKRLLLVNGYPASQVSVDRHTRDRGFRPMCYLAGLIPPSKLEIAADSRPANSRADVFVHYDMDCELFQFETCSSKMVNPVGISGGGLWQAKKHQAGVWTAQDARLIAIQSGWWEPGKYLRATRISHWLKLVHRDYPDLRRELEAHFPELRKPKPAKRKARPR